ncbi:M20/M25/M40 family metallo-hydrolase [Svornostia abyssi]|uniref:M20/M25/M40 family metallo-hydrolase n=1 Tax=Svornostia abyssi TaxID=2898438 RepID=A0ABY5PMU8_9ACTN|nr:M20/M25/M40 family metallo-hydrolase [Parviterribacteraceae bacterium J379]
MDDWITQHADVIARRAVRDLEALVGVSSPSGDVPGAEEAIAIAAALAPTEAEVARLPCSTPRHAPDLLLRLPGTGTRRILLLGHLDTVIGHVHHRPLEVAGDRLNGSGTVDMKGGVVLALGVQRALLDRPADYASADLLLVCDEEWRTGDFGHTGRFAGYDACLCFEAGEHDAEGHDAVIVRRKAAGTLRVRAHGRSAHSGASPDDGRNALLALAAAAQAVAAHHAPAGPERLTAVPTVLHSGDAFNVVPAAGELTCDLRADSLEAIDAVVGAIPDEVGGATLEPAILRRWPGMDARESTAPLLARASARLGRPIIAAERGGASDASHFAATIPQTVDGLGPRGGGAHAPHEHVLASSLPERAAVALAVADAALTD